MVDDNTWPPEQPTSYIPLLLIHRQGNQGNRTKEEATAMAELMYSGNIGEVALVSREQSRGHEKFDKIQETSRATKEIEEILASLEKGKESAFILIKGAPGIGKTILLEEIAYRWANKELLHKFEFVLLVHLHDTSLQQIKTVDDLLQLFCIGDKNSTQIVTACAQYLFANGGKALTLLLDGYDEYPEHL